MAKASVETVKNIILTLSEDEAQAIFALTGRVSSNVVTESVYSALTDALGYPYEATYEVNSNTYGDRANALHLVKK